MPVTITNVDEDVTNERLIWFASTHLVNKRNAVIVRMRCDGWTYREIAEALGLSTVRCMQIFHGTEGKFRRYLMGGRVGGTRSKPSLPLYTRAPRNGKPGGPMLEELECSVRAANALRQAGVTSLNEVVTAHPDPRTWLMAQPNIGKKTCDEIMEWVKVAEKMDLSEYTGGYK